MFEDQRLKKKAKKDSEAKDNTEEAKVETKKEKRKFFDPSASNNMTIILKRLPKAELMRQNLLNWDNLQREHINKLISSWPDEGDILGLLEDQVSNPSDNWDFSETYML